MLDVNGKVPSVVYEYGETDTGMAFWTIQSLEELEE